MDIVSRGENYPLASQGMPFRNPTITERLKTKKEILEANLAEVNEALEALEKNPEVSRVIDLISKVNY